MNLAENLKRIRKENSISQEQLAEKLGVSRQSVSKWESGQAYPEMDKVLQLAKMFDLNIDDLLNQDIRQVNSEKQSKMIINKYIDDFLFFITRTIDMFSSMKFRDKCKCLFEQFVIICLLILLFLIIGAIGSSILFGLISMLPYSIINIIYSICSSIYLVIALVLGIILLIHIFKVRYLDYYVIVKDDSTLEDKDSNGEKENVNEDKNVYLEKKKEKIIIRDSKHSGYRFISGTLKCLLFCIKFFTIFIALFFCISLVCFVLSFVASFLIVKTGLFFFGIILSILSCIIINIIILIELFNFIISKKSKKKYLFVTFISSLILFGIGIGISIISFTSFDYIDDINNDIYLEDELNVSMKDNLIIHDYLDIEYVEEDRSDIRISYKHTKHFTLDTQEIDNNIYLHKIYNDNNFLDVFRDSIKDINNKKIINYSNFKIYIHTSKENIDKLKNNLNDYLEHEQEEFDYYNEIEVQNYEYQNKIYELEQEIEFLKSE